MSGDVPLLLASASETRARLLRNAGVAVVQQPANVDEAALKATHRAHGSSAENTAHGIAVTGAPIMPMRITRSPRTTAPTSATAAMPIAHTT